MTQREVDAKIEQSADVAAAETETDTVVADYLCRHPDFFVRHPDVLRMMAPPNRWSDDGVVDMQRYLVERHRGEIDDLRNCAQEVIETSRSNLSTQTRTHAAVLSLLNVTDIDALVLTATDDWPLLLDVDIVALGFEPAPGGRLLPVSDAFSQLPAGAVDEMLEPEQDVRLVHKIEDDGTIFGCGAGIVCSAALTRLRPAGPVPVGLMALGSCGNAFNPGQGTELITFLGRALESRIHGLIGAG